MHPTWRDLVIDRLAGEADLRRRFLARCGPHGVVLALSTGGGAEGQRVLPLIADDGDWDAIGDRIYALLPELDHAELAAVLRAMLSVVQIVNLDWMAAREARGLARMALERTASLWVTAGAPVLLDCVDAWLSLSDRLDPRVWPGFLGPTWAELLPGALPDPEDLAEVQRFTDWVTLCELLAEFSQELLEQLGFGPEQDALIHRNRATEVRLMRTSPSDDPPSAWGDTQGHTVAESTVRRGLADL